MENPADDHNSDSDFEDISALTLRKITETAEKVGYTDGVVDGKDGAFQQSFDEGYAVGLRIGMELEKYKAFFEHLEESTEELKREKTKYLAMELSNCTSKLHFQYDKREIGEDIQITAENQQYYLTTLLEKFARELPIATKSLRRTE